MVPEAFKSVLTPDPQSAIMVPPPERRVGVAQHTGGWRFRTRRMLHFWESHNPLNNLGKADLAAGISLLGASVLWTWLTLGRLYDPIVDQGWYMQVAARLVAGDVLYRDMIWMYGPLPIYLLALLFRWMGTHVTTFFLLYYLLAALGCLLTYRIARFLLAPPLAFLGTVALFLGGGGAASWDIPRPTPGRCRWELWWECCFLSVFCHTCKAASFSGSLVPGSPLVHPSS